MHDSFSLVIYCALFFEDLTYSPYIILNEIKFYANNFLFKFIFNHIKAERDFYTAIYIYST